MGWEAKEISQEEIKRIAQEAVDKINGKKRIDVKKDKATVEQIVRAEVNKQKERERWRHIINTELQIYDYILYGLINEYDKKVVEAAKSAGVFGHFSKARGKIAENAKLAVGFQTCCQLSEKVEFSTYVAGFFDLYKKEYSREGSSFVMMLQFRSRSILRPHLQMLHNCIRKGVKASNNNKYTDLIIALYEVHSLNKQIEVLTESCMKKLVAKTGYKGKLFTPTSWDKYANNVWYLINEYQKEDISEYNKKIIDEQANKVLGILDGEEIGKIIDDCFKLSMSDYAQYCIAQMLLNTRKQGAISDNEKKALEKIHIENDAIERFQKELRKSKVAISESDPYELREKIPNIKKGVWIHRVKKKIIGDTK